MTSLVATRTKPIITAANAIAQDRPMVRQKDHREVLCRKALKSYRAKRSAAAAPGLPIWKDDQIAMGLLDLFRKPAAIESLIDMEDFLDTRSAFMVQKCVFEYSRARAGILWQKLFSEEGFKAAVSRSTWRNYPLCLENIAVMVEQVLRPNAGDRQAELRAGIKAATTNVTDRYPVPEGFKAQFWADARDRIAARIERAGLAAPHPVKDLPKETIREFFDDLPVHESLRGHDFILVQNNLRSNLCQMHDEFVGRADLPALTRSVIAGPSPVAVPPVGRLAG